MQCHGHECRGKRGWREPWCADRWDTPSVRAAIVAHPSSTRTLRVAYNAHVGACVMHILDTLQVLEET